MEHRGYRKHTKTRSKAQHMERVTLTIKQVTDEANPRTTAETTVGVSQ